MRIGIMCLASFGGSARIATELATELSHRGHTVHLFTRTPPFDNERYRNRRLILHTVSSSRETDQHPAKLDNDWPADVQRRYLSQILDCIVTNGLDVLHFHYALPFAFVAAQIKDHLGWAAPLLVGTLHGTDVSNYGRNPLVAPRLARALRRLDGLTTVSHSHAQLAADYFHLPARPHIIPNFIDLSKFQPAANGKTNGHAAIRRPRIAHVSNFRPVKDTPSVADIFVRLRQHVDAELWLIGEGPDMPQVQAALREAGVEQHVRYWGLQQDVGHILAQTDLLLMTSRAESFCLAALEAMACGVPVLSTRVGGLPEVVLDGVTGALFPVGDHDLAARLGADILANPFQLQAMRLAALRRAAHFSSRQVVPRYEAYYRSLLKTHRSFPVAVTAARL
ncbi:MAG: N-acetyl-alpha-D-glucosaminyl L-malate synthase [Anaerolineae bacterium]|nr:N-acetyl-alpha-D-glucosaminyl L-malate synthase [Anaerolineae bacterium]